MFKIKDDKPEQENIPEIKDTKKAAFVSLIVSVCFAILAVILVIILICIKK